MIIVQLQKVGSHSIRIYFLVKDETIREKGILYTYRCKYIQNHCIRIASEQFPDLFTNVIYLYGNDKSSDDIIRQIDIRTRTSNQNIERDILYDEYINALKEYSKHSGIPIIVSEFKNLERMVN